MNPADYPEPFRPSENLEEWRDKRRAFLRREIVKAMPPMLRDEREWRLEQYSSICEREVTSSKELNDDELLLVYYCTKYEPKFEVDQEHWACFDANRKSHMQILSLARQCGWVKGKYVDANRLSTFIQSNKSPVNHPLMLLHRKEISKLIIALEGILEHTVNTI